MKNANSLYYSETLTPVPNFFNFVIYSLLQYMFIFTFSMLAPIEYKLNKTFGLHSRILESNKEREVIV